MSVGMEGVCVCVCVCMVIEHDAYLIYPLDLETSSHRETTTSTVFLKTSKGWDLFEDAFEG